MQTVYLMQINLYQPSRRYRIRGLFVHNCLMSRKRGLPERLRPLFGDYTFSSLSITSDRDLIIRRILSQGSWDAVRWLRRQVGDSELRAWLISHRGRGVSPRQLRFWELIYDLPKRDVNRWVQAAQNGIWAKR